MIANSIARPGSSTHKRQGMEQAPQWGKERGERMFPVRAQETVQAGWDNEE